MAIPGPSKYGKQWPASQNEEYIGHCFVYFGGLGSNCDRTRGPQRRSWKNLRRSPHQTLNQGPLGWALKSDLNWCPLYSPYLLGI